MDSVSVTSSGGGDVTIMGTGGGAFGDGIEMLSDSVTSSAGTITLSGAGGNTGTGIDMIGGSVTSSVISITGTGGAGAGDGIDLSNGAAISGSGTINGTGGGTSGWVGILMNNSSVTSSGDGLTIMGTGGSGGDGILLESASSIISGSDAISLDGTAGSGGTGAYGVYMNAASVTSSGGGDITITGAGAGGRYAIYLTGGSGADVINSVGTSDGSITLIADSMNLLGGSIDAGTNIVTMEPQTSGEVIALGGTGSGLSISDADLGAITAGVVRIGGSSAGNITINGVITSHSGFDTLDLITADSVSESTGALSVSALAIQASGGAVLTANANSIDNIAGTAGIANGISLFDSSALTVDTVDGIAGINVDGEVVLFIASGQSLTVNQPIIAGSDITLEADNMTIGASVSTDGNVFIAAVSNGQAIDIGGADAIGTLGLDSTDLGNISASELQIGSGGSDISISAALSFSNVPILYLDGNTISTDDPSDSLTVPNLALQAAGDIGTSDAPIITDTSNLVAQSTSGGIDINNTGDLTIGFDNDPFQGVSTISGDIELTNAGNVYVTSANETLYAGGNLYLHASAGYNVQTGGNQTAIATGAGNITITAGQDILLSDLAPGSIQANESDSSLTGDISLSASRDVILSGSGNGSDISTNYGTIHVGAGRNILVQPGQISTNNGGSITIFALANFTMGSGGSDQYISTQSGGGDITITAATMTINGPIEAIGGTVTLDQNPGTENIDLGTNPSSGNLGLSQSDLDNIQADLLVIGNSEFEGNIVITSPITSTAGWSNLSLVTAGSISQNDPSDTLTVNSLALTGDAGIGSVGSPLAIIVSNLVAQSSSGGIDISNSGDLTIGFDGDPFHGVSTVTGDINLTTAGSLYVVYSNENIYAGGNLTVTATGSTSNIQTAGYQYAFETAAGSITITAGQDIILGGSAGGQDGPIGPAFGLDEGWGAIEANKSNSLLTGDITLNAGRDLIIQGYQNSYVMSYQGSINATAGRDITLYATPYGGSIFTSTGAGDIALTAGRNFYDGYGNSINTGSGGGDITITAASMDIESSISSNSVVTLEQNPGDEAILFTATPTSAGLDLTPDDLAEISADTLRIGSTSSVGPIQIFTQINSQGDWNTLSLITAAQILDTNTIYPDITVSNLALQFTGGITLHTSISNLAFSNATSGDLDIFNNGALTIASIDQLGASSNTGGAVMLIANGPVAFDTSTIANNTISAIAANGSGDGDINVDAGVNVESTLGNISFLAGDNISTGHESMVISDIGSVTMTSGAALDGIASSIDMGGDVDGGSVLINLGSGTSVGATLTLDGTIAGASGVNVLGGSGADTIQIDFDNDAYLPDGMNLNGASGNDTLIANDTTTTSAETYILTPTSLSRGGPDVISYQNIPNVQVNGGSGADTFDITPSSATQFTVNGNNPAPPANPGDTLSVDYTSLTGITLSNTSSASGNSGSIDFNNRQPVDYTGIESLPVADVSVTTSTPLPVVEGNNMVYTITVTNNGSVDATGVDLLDALPANARFVSAVQASGNPFTSTLPLVNTINGTVKFASGSIAAGTSATFTITIDPDGGSNLNNVSVTSNEPDVNQANNIASATTVVTDAPLTNSSVTLPNSIAGDSTGLLTLGTFTDAYANSAGDPLGAAAFTATITWASGNVTSGTITQSTTNKNLYTVTGSTSFASAGTYPVSILISDADGQTTTISDSEIVTTGGSGSSTAPDSALVATGGQTFSAVAGQSTGTLTLATFTDPGGAEATTNYSASINWGDGSATDTSALITYLGNGIFAVTDSHTYATENINASPYTISIIVHHAGQPDSNTVTDSANVYEMAPTVTAINITAVEQSSTGVVPVARFSDSNALPVGDYSATINWGDGTSSTGTIALSNGVFTVFGKHTYESANTYSSVVTITRPLSQDASATGTAVITPIAIKTRGVTIHGTEGTSLTATVAKFTTKRPNAVASDYVATIDWGNGQITTGVVLQDSPGHFHVTGTVTYAQNSAGGRNIVKVSIDRVNSTQTVVASHTKIKDVKLTDATAASSLSGHANVALSSAILGTFIDPNPLSTSSDQYSALIHWGDGSTSDATFVLASTNAAGGHWEILGSHTYAAAGNYMARIALSDISSPNHRLYIKTSIAIS